MSFSIKSCL